MNSRFAVIILFCSSIGWGLTWLPLKYLNDMGLDSLQLIFIAFTSATVVLLPWLFRQFSSWKSHTGFMVLIALTGGLANASFQTAIYHGDVIRVMILFYMLPVWSVLGGRLFLKEKVDKLRLSAVALCLSGAFVILDVWHNSWSGVNWIDFLALGSGLGLATSIILFRFTQTIPVMSKVSSVFIGCTVLTGLTLLVTPSQAQLPANNAVIFAGLYGAIWVTLVTLGTQWAVTQMEAGRSSVIIVMELVAAVISIALLTEKDLQWTEIIGGLMVLSAALLEGSRNEDTEQAVSMG